MEVLHAMEDDVPMKLNYMTLMGFRKSHPFSFLFGMAF